ncbi:LOW QUALITY PROTEIN: hypothetical protein V2J09_010742 [Rumex salicifolius]
MCCKQIGTRDPIANMFTKPLKIEFFSKVPGYSKTSLRDDVEIKLKLSLRFLFNLILVSMLLNPYSQQGHPLPSTTNEPLLGKFSLPCSKVSPIMEKD